jgi:putative ABC transport system permease protein
MIPREIWQVAFDALRANKVRAFLTMLGVVIGSACIVLVVTVALTGKSYILGQIEGVGSNIVYARYVREGPAQASWTDEVSLGDLEAVRNMPGVIEAAGTVDIPSTVVAEGVERPVEMVGVTEGFQRVRNLMIVRGRPLDPDDYTARSKVGIITQELAAIVFPQDDPVGKSIRVGELRFTVVGVFRERVSTFGQSEIKRETLVVPFPLMSQHMGDAFIRVLYVQASTPEQVPVLTRQVEEILKSRHRPGAEYLVENLTSLLQAAGNISLALTIILLLIAFIALAVSGIGIMNIMLVTVTQRTREIGIRKAIGARRKEILSQFLLEAFLISATGGVIGIAIAVTIPVLVAPLLPGDLTVPISGVSIAVALLVSCFTGVLFGYLPANRAAKLHPTESLRYE